MLPKIFRSGIIFFFNLLKNNNNNKRFTFWFSPLLQLHGYWVGFSMALIVLAFCLVGSVVFLCIITYPFEIDCLEQLASELVSPRPWFCIPACLFDCCGIVAFVLFFLFIPFGIDCVKELSGALIQTLEFFAKPLVHLIALKLLLDGFKFLYCTFTLGFGFSAVTVFEFISFLLNFRLQLFLELGLPQNRVLIYLCCYLSIVHIT